MKTADHYAARASEYSDAVDTKLKQIQSAAEANEIDGETVTASLTFHTILTAQAQVCATLALAAATAEAAQR